MINQDYKEIIILLRTKDDIIYIVGNINTFL